MAGSPTSIEITLAQALDLTRDCLCHDRRDKVYGLLGLATDLEDGDIEVDYTYSVEGVYEKVIEPHKRRNINASVLAMLKRSLLRSLFSDGREIAPSMEWEQGEEGREEWEKEWEKEWGWA